MNDEPKETIEPRESAPQMGEVGAIQDVERDAGADEKKAEDNPSSISDSNGETGPDSNETPPDNDRTAVSAEPAPEEGTEEPEKQRTKAQTNLIVGALCSAVFLAALDVTIVTTAIPTIIGEFRSPLGYTWIGSAYLLANAVAVPSWGKFSAIWGRKPILLLSVAVFWVGSLLCALSVNMGMLIASRAIQGVGGGGIVTLVNITISDLFSQRQRGVYYGWVGGVWAVASAVGPILGGVFTSEVTWRWCFYVNLPISGVGFAVLAYVLKLHHPGTGVRDGLKAVDWTGTVLITGGTLMFLFGLEFGGITFPWKSAATICLIVFGALMVVAFYFWEEHAKYPLIPRSLFAQWRNNVAFFVSFCHGLVFISGSYWLPLYFQAVLGASSLMSGVYLIPYAVSLSLLSAITGNVIRRWGRPLPPIIFGMAVMALGFGLFIDLGARRNFVKMIIYQIIAGIGVGPNFQSPLIAIQSRLPPTDAGVAVSTFNFVRQISTSVSVVIGGVIFQNSMQNQYTSLVDALGSELADQLSGSSAAGNTALVASLEGPDGDLARAAYWTSLRNIYIFSTAWAGLGLIASPFIGTKVLSKEHKEFKTGLQTLRRQGEDEPTGGKDKEES